MYGYMLLFCLGLDKKGVFNVLDMCELLILVISFKYLQDLKN
jgi:hypothetical protein